MSEAMFVTELYSNFNNEGRGESYAKSEWGQHHFGQGPLEAV
jgi:hypothetical protein